MTACAAGPDDVTPLSLSDTAWSLSSTSGGPLQTRAANVEITLEFSADRASGSGGCNRYQATYTLSGDRLVFGPVGATKRGCLDGRGEAEQAWFAVLGSTLIAQRQGESLTLRDANGVVYTLIRDTGDAAK